MHSELRQDLVTGDWILIAPGRAKRPDELVKKTEKRAAVPKKDCPFEDPQKSGNLPAVFQYGEGNKWQLQIIPNRFPAVMGGGPKIGEWEKHGPYLRLAGFGHHEIVITRDHNKNFAGLSGSRANEVFRAFHERYRMLAKESSNLAYISIFHNWGKKAGASLYHPHYQMISLPIVPPDVAHSLHGSKKYFLKNNKCVHCLIISEEKHDKKRIIFENAGAVVFAPYVSRTPFELRVFPKRHSPYFEEADKAELAAMAEALQRALKLIKTKLHDPDYNFFIHTAPVLLKSKHGHYHWHIEVRPHISIPAGFELSTGIDINVVDPDEAARLLKSRQK